ncbi:MAG: hypothetical protein WC683_04565 [bacterium]
MIPSTPILSYNWDDGQRTGWLVESEFVGWNAYHGVYPAYPLDWDTVVGGALGSAYCWKSLLDNGAGSWRRSFYDPNGSEVPDALNTFGDCRFSFYTKGGSDPCVAEFFFGAQQTWSPLSPDGAYPLDCYFLQMEKVDAAHWDITLKKMSSGIEITLATMLNVIGDWGTLWNQVHVELANGHIRVYWNPSVVADPGLQCGGIDDPPTGVLLCDVADSEFASGMVGFGAYVTPDAPAFRSASTWGGGPTDALPIPKPLLPSPVVENDFMLATIATFGAGARTITPPSGWTLIRRTTQADLGGYDFDLATYWKVAGDSEPGPYTWLLDSVVYCVGAIVAESGSALLSPIDSEGGDSGYGSPASGATAPSIVVTTANSLLLASFATLGAAFTGAPAGMVERFNAAGAVLQIEGSDEVFLGTGATGSRTATWYGYIDQYWCAHLCALRPYIQGQHYFDQLSIWRLDDDWQLWGSIQGYTSYRLLDDPLLPFALVSARNLATGVEYTAISNGAAFYDVKCPAGWYEVTAVASEYSFGTETVLVIPCHEAEQDLEGTKGGRRMSEGLGEMGPCYVYYGPAGAELELGKTHGGVRFFDVTDSKEITFDQFGTTEWDRMMIGRNVRVELNLAELSLENWDKVVPYTTMTGATPSHRKLVVYPSVGQPGMRDLAQQLILKKMENGAPSTDPERWVTFPKAFPETDLEIVFDPDTQRTMKIIFRVFPFSETDSYLYILGDETAT